jgi:hypothetical protein
LREAVEALQTLAELERRYDGPIPEPLRNAARLGSAEQVLTVEALGQADFFATLLRNQIQAIRRARAGGTARPNLWADLALYRRRRRFRRAEAARRGEFRDDQKLQRKAT